MSKITTYYESDPGFDPAAQAYFTKYSITDVIEQNATNTFVLTGKADNWWDKMTAIYPISPSNLAAAAGNLKDVTKFEIAWIGNPTHTTTGVDFNGTTQYGKTGIIPSTDLTDNDVHLSYYSRDNFIGSEIEMGCIINLAAILQLGLKFADGKMYFSCYNFPANTLAIANADSRGLGIGSRRSSADYETYMNAVSLATGTSGGGGMPGIEMYLGARNSATGARDFSTKECAFASAGLGLTDTDVTNLTNAVQIYQQNVIPGGRAVV